MTGLPRALLDRPIAHRGFHGPGRPENSVSAGLSAAKRGFGIEIDVQLSGDGQAMVFHDATLDRMTGESGDIRARNAADLETIPLAGSDETISSLAAFLGEINGQVPVLIEIKDQSGVLGPGDTAIEQSVAAAIVAAGARETVAVMSFNPESVAKMADLLPNIPRGLVTDPFSPTEWTDVPQARLAHLRDMADYDRVSAQFISHNAKDLDAPPVASVRAKGGAVLCWTIRSPAEEATARRFADNVTFEGYDPDSVP
ncbi:MAG: glycerophosphodiester phosphodiesterase family protein [Pseudomonadota bacterium]